MRRRRWPLTVFTLNILGFFLLKIFISGRYARWLLEGFLLEFFKISVLIFFISYKQIGALLKMLSDLFFFKNILTSGRYARWLLEGFLLVFF